MEVNQQRTTNNVRVFIRIRPFSQREVADGSKGIIVCDYKENAVALKKTGVATKVFTFDHLFAANSAQLDIYRIIAAPLVEQALEGYNGTIFAYGQTGTGKTYTMAGSNTSPELKGIIPNTFSHIFAQISNASEEKSFVVKVTYLEIYNEEVRDLLGSDPNKKLQIKERTDIGIYVKDLSGFTVDSVESITELLNRGNRNRMTRSTMMNNISSRSHAIFTIAIESKNRKDNQTTVGKLNLVDLAGSERIKRTQVTGERLREAGSINQSLSVLGNVISALVEEQPHIPYRNSKLTRLLQDSLGGNSKTSMIALVSPAEIDYEESLCTLRYAHRVKFIKNHAKINVEEKGLIEHFEQEIAELQQKLSLLSMRSEKPKQKKKDKSEADLEKLKKTEEEMLKIDKEKKELEDRMVVIQKKIICGGENLLEKAQQQEFLLLNSGQELEILDRSHQQLEEQFNKMTEEKIDIEEKYSSLQEEDAALNKKIKKVQQGIKEAKEEYADKEHEYQREMEALQDNNRLLIRESQLSNLMIDYYVPIEYKKMIQQHLLWNSETQEYQMRGVAYTGNNMRKRLIAVAAVTHNPVKFDMKQVYHKYPEKKKEKPSKRSLLKTYSAVPKSH